MASVHNDLNKIKETLNVILFNHFRLVKFQSLIWTKCTVVVISLIQNLMENAFANFHTLENLQSKFRKGRQKQFCKNANLKIVFTSFKINNYFSDKDKTSCFWSLF